MQVIRGERIYSATDLTNYLACHHLSSLQVARLEGWLGAPPSRPAGTADLAAEKGIEHEERHLQRMRDLHGDELVAIRGGAGEGSLERAAAETLDAMRAGAPVIYQAAFLADGWMGYPDFLERVSEPSELGDWSYQPVDAKLARSAKPHFVIQLCLYAELIEAAQGTTPPNLGLILGNNERVNLAPGDFRAYFDRMKKRFLTAMEPGAAGTYPSPVEHCEVCDWAEPCEERRIADDHLSQVAKLGGAQASRLESASIATVAALAVAEPDVRPTGMSEETFAKLRSQAALQVAERDSGELGLELLEPADPGSGPPRGLALLPPPSDGDVFFDIEGDPFYDDGLEYLWGVTYREDGELAFRSFWGLDHGEEKRALEDFVDFVFERRRRYPDLHVYHYAPYERTALGRLMGCYGTREEEVDDLFRQDVLVDLYRVVEQSMRISRPSYSLKEVERFYDQGRDADVKRAGDSVLMFERWRESREPRLLEEIEAYNKEDCDSTLRLREWLLERRGECEAEFGVEIPWRHVGEPPAPDEDREQAASETARLQERLLDGVPEKAEERSALQADAWLLAQLLDYHRREAKPGYWELFDRLEKSDWELLELDGEAIAGLERAGQAQPLPPPSHSSIQRFSFPPQEHKIRPGKYKDPHSCGIDPETGESDLKPKSIEVVEVRDQEGTIDLKLSAARLAEEQTALIPGGPYGTDEQRGALCSFAEEAIDRELDDVARNRAGRDILRRSLSRSAAIEPGEPLQERHADEARIKEVAGGLEDSYLFIQGPPGSGKTYMGAQVILDLIDQGKTVGVTANSHKAINNLLAMVEARAGADAELRGLKRSSEADQEYRAAGDSGRAEPLIGNSTRNEDFYPGSGLDLIGGTAWLWCREEMRASVDYLVIDEAGQISLADAIALATAARNVILLGDPLQLAQVSQGTHPPGSGVSVLEHLLGDHGTIPRDRGFFLDLTRRMHPDVCDFVSKAVYEGRLDPDPSCALQSIVAEGELTGTGVRSIAVAHRGNSRQSEEEAEAIVERIGPLLGAAYTNREGETSPLAEEQVMVVTPYNAQVRCIREHLDREGFAKVPVGTVDKFQGQEAAVVFFSMATSSGAEIPRNVEFLYSRNRLNVAVSRAQCLAVLVASPELMGIECHTVEQMRLVNALCMLDEMGQRREG